MLLLLSHLESNSVQPQTPQMAAHQAPPSLGFSRQEHWSGLPFPSPMREGEKWKWSRSVVSDSQRPHGLQPTRLLRPWDFPGKSTGVGCHCLLHMIIYLILNISIDLSCVPSTYQVTLFSFNPGLNFFLINLYFWSCSLWDHSSLARDWKQATAVKVPNP